MKMVLMIIGAVGVLLPASSTTSKQMPALNVTEWRSAKEILTRARELIVEKGWQQGSTVVIEKQCVATAMEDAWKELGRSLVDFEYSRDAISTAIELPRIPVTRANDPLDVPYWGRNLMYWNDKPGRTVEEVLAAFDKAISIAGRRYQAALKANVSPDALSTFDATTLKAVVR